MRLKRFLLLVILVIGLGTTAGIAFAQSEAVEENANYEIYPTPREVNYSNGHFTITDEINVVFDDGIDDATRSRANEVFLLKSENISESDAKKEGVTNVFVATTNNLENEKTNARDYINDKYTDEIKGLDFENKIDPYYLGVFKNDFIILGQNSNAAFYAITTLMHVFNQIDRDIQEFDVYDYADTPTRGFIEGYYGIPWSVEDRISLMEFGGDFKMTSYIFAPKNDPYHAEKWRDPYPKDKLADMERMAKVGNETKCRFVWTAHPFRGGFNQSKVEEEIDALIAKFEQLYSVGVRQFGVLGDDVGALPLNIIVQVMTRVSEWANKKTADKPNDPVYPTLFCPAGYNHAWQNGAKGNGYAELNKYDKEFPKDIQIFWTGDSVCAPITQQTLNNFRTFKSNGQTRRAPLFWLNWPVNDVNHGRMVMGRGEQLRDVNPADLSGVVSNPMQEAEASKVALFAVADYGWNVKGFKMDKSWADSFKYIEPNAAEELHTLAKHMSDPSPNVHNIILSESEDLKPYLDEFKDACLKNDNARIEAAAQDLIAEMNIIVDACSSFHEKSKNAKLKEELLPFTNALSDMSNAIILYIETKLAIISGDSSSAVRNYIDANAYFSTSSDYYKPGLGTSKHVASPAGKRIKPFMNWLKEYLADPVSSIVGGTNKFTITPEQHFAVFKEQGNNKLGNTVDGNNQTYFWNAAYIQANDYIDFVFSKPQDIYGIHILAGSPEKPADTFYNAKIIVFTEGGPEQGIELEQKFNNYTSNINVTGISFENVTRVRFQAYGDIKAPGETNAKWFAMREFSVDLEPTAEKVVGTPYRTTTDWKISTGEEGNMFDNNLSTYVHYNVRGD